MSTYRAGVCAAGLETLLCLVLQACAPSQSAVQTAIAGTQAAHVTPAEAIVLDSVPFRAGDLPGQYSSGQVTYQWPADLPEPALPANLVLQKVGWDISSGFNDDYVLIALFETQEELDSAFAQAIAVRRAPEAHPAAVGDRSAFAMVSTFSGDGFFAFTKCAALAVIRITGADVAESLLKAYAQRIDRRLAPLVCRP